MGLFLWSLCWQWEQGPGAMPEVGHWPLLHFLSSWLGPALFQSLLLTLIQRIKHFGVGGQLFHRLQRRAHHPIGVWREAELSSRLSLHVLPFVPPPPPTPHLTYRGRSCSASLTSAAEAVLSCFTGGALCALSTGGSSWLSGLMTHLCPSTLRPVGTIYPLPAHECPHDGTTRERLYTRIRPRYDPGS
jgi:hypothetical protein